MTTRDSTQDAQYAPNTSVKEHYQERLREKWDGISFRIGVLLVLTAVAFMQISIVSSLFDAGIMTEGEGSIRTVFQLLGLLVNFLLVREVLNITVYASVSLTGKHPGYLIAAVVVAAGLTYLWSSPVPDMETAQAIRRMAYMMGGVLGLEVALHGSVTARQVRRLNDRLEVLG